METKSKDAFEKAFTAQANDIERRKQLLKNGEKLLQAAQKMIEEGKRAPMIGEMKLASMKRAATREKWFGVMDTFKDMGIKEHMEGRGWLRGHHNPTTGVMTFGRKDMPDHKIIYKGGKFSITYKGETEESGISAKDSKTLKFISPDRFIKKEQIEKYSEVERKKSEAFASAKFDSEVKAAKELLKQAGWIPTPGRGDNTTKYYTNGKDAPGLDLVISIGTNMWYVRRGTHPVTEKAPLSKLSEYLNAE